MIKVMDVGHFWTELPLTLDGVPFSISPRSSVKSRRGLYYTAELQHTVLDKFRHLA